MPPKPLIFLSPIHKAIRRIELYMQGALAGLDASSTDGHLLSYLRSYAPCPISELHRVFGLKKSTLTSVLDRLENRDLVARHPHPDDRRSTLLHITDEGLALAELIQRPVDELERNIRAEITDRDLAGFRRVLEAIGSVTEVDVKSPPQSPNPHSKEKP